MLNMPRTPHMLNAYWVLYAAAIPNPKAVPETSFTIRILKSFSAGFSAKSILSLQAKQPEANQHLSAVPAGGTQGF